MNLDIDGITIEDDGHDDQPDLEGRSRRSSIGVPAAVGFVSLLAVGVIAMFTVPALRGDGGSGASPELVPTTAAVVVDPTVATAASHALESDDVVATSPPTTAPPAVVTPEPSTSGSSPVESAQAAMDAWGRFAASGDLTQLDVVFDTTGPQYQQLAAEADTLRTSAAPAVPYTVRLDDPTVVSQTPTETVIATSALWQRPGETTQAYQWHLVLRPRLDGGWTLWTIRDSN